MNAEKITELIAGISDLMTENKDYLIKLDQQNGDGDLGISMSEGFKAVTSFMKEADEQDLGILMKKASTIFNEAAPSSLGTIISFGMMGIAKALKGKTDATREDLVNALEAGIEKIMTMAKSKPGEKTILDSLYPGVQSLKETMDLPVGESVQIAFDKAAEGSENTKNMKSVHGRAAYYGEKTIGMLDGGSVVGKLIFEGINDYFNK